MSSEFIDRMKQVTDHLTQARRLMDSGPLDYYLVKLVEHSEALLTKFAPFKVGDRACIVQPVPCPGGWAHSAKSLEVGAVGTISDVDYRDGDFVFGFVPDTQFYLSREGWWAKLETSPYNFPLKFQYLGPLLGVEDGCATGGG
jgi:hypothetical protein